MFKKVVAWEEERIPGELFCGLCLTKASDLNTCEKFLDSLRFRISLNTFLIFGGQAWEINKSQ